MDITTKASPGDLIYYIRDNHVCSSTVKAIQIRVAADDFNSVVKGRNHDPFDPKSVGIFYFTCHGRIRENELFLSQEDIAKAIIDGTFNEKVLSHKDANEASQF